jgi:hypothetical protein
LLSVAGALGGCTNVGLLLQQARGPNPNLVAADVEASTINEINVMDSLLRRAQLGFAPEIPSPRWYLVVPAGFSYVDEVCNTYIRALYDLDRDRDRIKSGLIMADKATSAILGVTDAGPKAIQIAAQAFGLAANGTDIFVDRYQFKVEPSIVYLTLEKMRTQYRTSVAALAPAVQSPAQVILVLRKYLSLCQPSFIEATINEYVAVAGAGSNIDVSDVGPRSGPGLRSRGLRPARGARAVDPSAIDIFLVPPAR